MFNLDIASASKRARGRGVDSTTLTHYNARGATFQKKDISMKSIAATAAFVACIALSSAFSSAGAAPATAKGSAAPSATAIPASQSTLPSDKQRTAMLQKACDEAQAKILASKSETSALVDAVRSKNSDIAKRILIRNGFPSRDLESAKFTFVDDTGGKTGPAGITIRLGATCCPPELVIRIRF